MKVIILGTGDIALEVLRKLQDDVRINVLGVICDASVKYEANESISTADNGGRRKDTGVSGRESYAGGYYICV